MHAHPGGGGKLSEVRSDTSKKIRWQWQFQFSHDTNSYSTDVEFKLNYILLQNIGVFLGAVSTDSEFQRNCSHSPLMQPQQWKALRNLQENQEQSDPCLLCVTSTWQNSISDEEAEMALPIKIAARGGS